MSLFSKATCLSNIRSHSASRLGGWGGEGVGGGARVHREKMRTERGSRQRERGGEKKKKSEEVPHSLPRKGGQQK